MTSRFSRRRFLATTGAVAGVAALGAPAIVRAADRKIKVGTYGGYFEGAFKEHIYPEFTKATGIEVESVGVPTGETWLVQIRNAARAKKAPADVSMMAGVPRLRGDAQGLFLYLDEAKLPNLSNLSERFQSRNDKGQLYGCGAVSWYITLCSNTKEIPEEPTSWAEIWDPKNENQLGLLALASNSYLLEITAKTHFGGTDFLDTKEGIEKAFTKLTEVTPNVRLWYKDEGAFQQALQDGEIPMGQYYHDVTGLAAAEGFPVRSTFPKEGGVIDSGYWVVPKQAKPVEEAHVFIDYICQPSIQAALARNVGTAPVVDRAKTDLTDAEFASVSSDIDPIVPKYQIYIDHADWITDRWTQMISSS